MKRVLSYTAAATLLSQTLVFGETTTDANVFDRSSRYDYNSIVSDTCQSSTTTAQPVTTDAADEADNNDEISTAGDYYENKYASQYSQYYSSYWNGSDGDGGYDLNNDGPNGYQKSQRIMCKCSKKSASAHHPNNAFSKCMNNEYGNNAKTWESKYAKYINYYRQDNNNNNNNNGRGRRRNKDNKEEEEPVVETTQTPEEPAVENNNNNNDDDNEDYSGPNNVLPTEEATYEVNNDNDDFNNNNIFGTTEEGGVNGVEPTNTGFLVSGLSEKDVNGEGSNFTHSDYMSYLATFLIFVGAILFVLVGYNCLKYTWKTYKLRNYEAIGDSGVKTDELQSNKLKKHDRIRLPRKEPRRVETLDETNKMKYYDQKATYTIGEV